MTNGKLFIVNARGLTSTRLVVTAITIVTSGLNNKYLVVTRGVTMHTLTIDLSNNHQPTTNYERPKRS